MISFIVVSAPDASDKSGDVPQHIPEVNSHVCSLPSSVKVAAIGDAVCCHVLERDYH